MLSFDLRTLEHQAAKVDGALAADDPVWEPSDLRPDGAIAVSGRVSTAGAGRFYWHGKIAGRVVLPCRRCLTDCSADVTREVYAIFSELTADAEMDDADEYIIDGATGELDLRPAVREEWLLTAPSLAVCKDDCRGLCPSCGTDLNLTECGCQPHSSDPRWAALHDLAK